VVAFDRYNPNNSWGWLENSIHKDELQVVLGDIRDYDSVYKASSGCDTVIHLAALIGIPYSYISPLAYIRTNIEGTYNILEAAKKHEFENIVITSTSETYGTAQFIPINEDHPLVGQSPYSASKIAADQLAISYYKSFNMPIKIARPFNTYGPRQSSRAIIPTIISQLLAGYNVLELGSLSPTRDLTYVSDTCDGLLEICKSEKLFGEVTNIGMNSEIAIGDLAKLIAKIIGVNNLSITSSSKRIRPKNSEVERLVCDNSKLITKTSWRPQNILEKGITKVIDWMKIRENLEVYKAMRYNV
tara:strand:+ start:5728 stop:6630 length:903 start_codon:yes stop_codon:yes gene_type:complete